MVTHISELLLNVDFAIERKAPVRSNDMTDLEYYEKCVYWYINPETIMTEAQIQNAQKENEKKQERIKQIAEQKYYEMLERAGVDTIFYHANINSLESWNPEHMKKILIIQDAYKAGKWLTFTGKTGKGKTFLSCAMIIDKLKHGKTAEILTSKHLIEKINGASFEKKESVTEIYFKLDFLVIDEMGRHSDTENSRNIIFDIIKKRHANLKQTVIASNMTNEELFGAGGFFDDVVSRRVSEAGKTIIFDWSYKSKEVLNDEEF